MPAERLTPYLPTIMEMRKVTDLMWSEKFSRAHPVGRTIRPTGRPGEKKFIQEEKGI